DTSCVPIGGGQHGLFLDHERCPKCNFLGPNNWTLLTPAATSTEATNRQSWTSPSPREAGSSTGSTQNDTRAGYWEHAYHQYPLCGARALSPQAFLVLHLLGHAAKFDVHHVKADWQALLHYFDMRPELLCSFFMCLICKLLEQTGGTPELRGKESPTSTGSIDPAVEDESGAHRTTLSIRNFEELVVWERNFAEDFVVPASAEHRSFLAELSHGENDLLRLEIDEVVRPQTVDGARGASSTSRDDRARRHQPLIVEIGAGNFTFAQAYCRKHGVSKQCYVATSKETRAELLGRYSGIYERAFNPETALFHVECDIDIVEEPDYCVSTIKQYCADVMQTFRGVVHRPGDPHIAPAVDGAEGYVDILLFNMPFADPDDRSLTHRDLMRAFFALARRIVRPETGKVVFTLSNSFC
ncbi:unnamed protein product, partial [Amoebophrya sp. A120]